MPPVPIIFFKPPTALIGDGDTIRLTRRLQPGGVRGRDRRRDREPAPERATAAQAERGDRRIHLRQRRHLPAICRRMDGQWGRAKGFDTFCPVGPAWSRDWTGAPRVDLPGERDRAPAGPLDRHAFSRFPSWSRFCSGIMTLEPGDLIATGTPAGTAPLADGDVVEVEIPGVGILSNPVAAETAMIEFSQRLQESARLPSRPRSRHQATPDRSRRGRDRPGRGRQRHAPAGGSGRGAPGGRTRSSAQQVWIPAGPARHSARRRPRWMERRFGIGFDPADRDAAPDRLEGRARRICRSRSSIRATSPSCRSRATRRTSAGRFWPVPNRTSSRSRPENGFLLRARPDPGGRSCARAKIAFVNYPNNPTAAVATAGIS